MRWLLIAVGLLIWLGTATEPLGAQGRVRAGAGVGIAMPSGVLQDQANPGWRALATLDVWLPEMPASLRVDAAYDRFGLTSAPDGSSERVTGARTIASASLSLSVGSSDSLSRVSPYALAGVTMNRIGLRRYDIRNRGRKVGVCPHLADGVECGHRYAVHPVRPARLRRCPPALRVAVGGGP